MTEEGWPAPAKAISGMMPLSFLTVPSYTSSPINWEWTISIDYKAASRGGLQEIRLTWFAGQGTWSSHSLAMNWFHLVQWEPLTQLSTCDLTSATIILLIWPMLRDLFWNLLRFRSHQMKWTTTAKARIYHRAWFQLTQNPPPLFHPKHTIPSN